MTNEGMCHVYYLRSGLPRNGLGCEDLRAKIFKEPAPQGKSVGVKGLARTDRTENRKKPHQGAI